MKGIRIVKRQRTGYATLSCVVFDSLKRWCVVCNVHVSLRAGMSTPSLPLLLTFQ
eukprot:m.108058 g.108058  ORF g.108058 m.108058 type:complete len:55 (-) comp9184_c8_seq1:1804-1968(-)